MTTMQTDFWRLRPVLVTGATGFLGGWLVQRLLDEGAEVVALVRDSVPESMLMREGGAAKIGIVHGALCDEGLVRRTIAEYGVQTVFHLGAQTLVGVAKLDPVSTLDSNVRGTWTLLEAARQGKSCQVVVASSDKAYGASTCLPYLETHALQGKFPYDVSKSCVDLISGMYAATYNLPVGIVRCGNLFGGGDLNFSRTIPGVIQSTLRDERFRIRSDGKYVRDFLYVEDAVDAYLCLAEGLAHDASLSGEAFNFSLERRITVLEIVEMVLDMMGRNDLEPEIQNIASAEIREQYLSAAKARERLRWTPRFGLQEGLTRTIDWYRRYFSKVEIAKAPAAAASA
jgi:CDP-glucose 4,6-dehydratase